MDSQPSESKRAKKSGSLVEKELGDFRLLRQLGAGGMAEVYLAEQKSLTRLVAVKILQDDAVSGKNDMLLKRFEQEARAAGGLSDPNIVQVYMIGHEGGTHFIVQEYVQGLNLSQWFKKNGCPDFHTGWKWMKQVASALKAAGEAGVVHRDIKPENIMLTHAGDAKVTDFGLAQLNETNENLNLTQQGTTMGTPWYMSPEQIQGEKLDHRSDQYSFGVTCYHMFAGQPPFPGKNSVSVAVKHLKEEARPLQEHRQDLPVELCQLVHRLMAKRPEDRFETPNNLLEDIERLKDCEVKSGLAPPNSVLEWLGASRPSGQFVAVGLAVCLFIGVFFGRRIVAPVRLNFKEPDYPQLDTAVQQYGKAILDPKNPEAWIAVTKHFPKSEEAIWAQIQLGIFFVTRQRNLPEATDWFKKAYDSAAGSPDLQTLALIGQAMVASNKLDNETYYQICNVELVDYHEQLRNPESPVPEALVPTLEQLQQDVLPPIEVD